MAEERKEEEKAVVAPHVAQLQKEYKDKAEDILENYCKVKGKRKDEIVEKMAKYIKDRKSGKLSEITGDEKRLINDAIHGPIELPPLIYQMINTEEFHRLKYLKQLGGTHYVYPGANHTRFEHSIGVYHIAGVFARSLKKQLEHDKEIAKKAGTVGEDLLQYRFDDEEVLCAEIAGLCHDLGHGPMSHMFESVMEGALKDEVKHEKISVSMFQRLLTHHNVLGELVLIMSKQKNEIPASDRVQLIEHMIRPPDEETRQKSERPFLYEIVANKDTGIDVDKWDYYQRDCHYLGILQDFEWKRTMLLGRIVKSTSDKKLHIGFREKEMDNLYGMFRTRANIYRKACKHKTVKAVERMFIDAMVQVKDLPIVWASKSDKGPGRFKSIKKAIKLATAKKPQLDWYMSMTDSIVDIIMSARLTDDSDSELDDSETDLDDSETELDKSQMKVDLEEAKKLLKRLAQRDIYKCVAKKRVEKKMTGQKESHVEVRTAQYLLENKEQRQNFGEAIHKHLPRTDQTIFKEEHLLVEVIKIKHPSEGEENPLEKAIIFKKPKYPNSLPRVLGYEEARKQASKVMVPQAFVEYEVRVYDTCCKDERSEQKINHKEVEEALNRALEDLRPIITSIMDEEARKKNAESSGESPMCSQSSGKGSQRVKRKRTESISDDDSECPEKRPKN